ncbi:MAG: VanW family protein [Clostridia bacterium]|nr:VanW family protein [Clostridia bacterium]
MNNNKDLIPKTSKKKTHVVIIIIAIMLALIVAAFGYFAYAASSSRVYDGVYIGDVHLGGMERDMVLETLEREYDGDELNPLIECEGVQFRIYGSQMGLGTDFEATADSAVAYGKDGSVFSKIKNMIAFKNNHQQIDLSLSCDMNLLQYTLSENLPEHITDVQQYTVEIGEDCLIVTNGKSGRGINGVEVVKAIAKAFTNSSLDAPVSVQIEDILPEAINPDAFCEEYNRDPVDAVCDQNGDNINIIGEVVGVKIDCDEAKRIIKANEKNTQSYIIPAVITYPEITAEELEAEFTDCVIGTFSTDYSSSSPNRKENIRLASSNINGKILNPGEVFSFNDIVGPRTSATGYKVAHVYSGSKVIDGIGGGICQVSSTLYNAVVFADLEIVYRTNHSLPVSYVPLGRDATVSYGTIDFKFKNNKETPVKLEVIADGSNLTVNIYGRKKYLKDISIETIITGSRQYSTTVIEDDTMYEDERKVQERGANGTNTQSYKIIKENGELVSRTLLAKSSYSPTTQVEIVGTKKRESIESQAPVLPEMPAIDEESTSAIEPTEPTVSSAADSAANDDVNS